MDLSSFFSYIAFDVTGAVTFSRPFGFLAAGADVNHGVATNIGLQFSLCVLGFYPRAAYLLNNPLVTTLGLLPVGHVVKTAVAALHDRRANPDVARFDMAAHWFRGADKAKQDGYAGFTDRHVLAAAVSNLGAGSDTVSCGLQTFVYCCIRQPALWRRLREEVDRAAAAREEDEGRWGTRVVSYEDAARLPFLEACVKESLRFMAPVPSQLFPFAFFSSFFFGGGYS